MILEYEIVKFIWALLIGLLFIGFAISGGSDLGVGALLIFFGKSDSERRTILNSIGPTWEGNQVWFVTAAGAIFAAWPFMYAAAFSGFYTAFLLLLLALILRPPGIDYRSKMESPLWRRVWDFALFLSGVIPLFLFGVAFGNLFYGIPFYYDKSLLPHYVGNFSQLLNPYSLLMGLTSLSILLLQAALFLQLKTTGDIQARALKAVRGFGLLFIVSFLIVWSWTLYKIDGLIILSIPDLNTSFSPLAKQVAKGVGYWSHNYDQYPLGYLAPILSIVFVAKALLLSHLKHRKMAIFCNSLALAGLVITGFFTLFPFIFPSSNFPSHSLTIWDAVSSQLTLTWMLAAALFFLPIILGYTFWVYRVMRGPVNNQIY